MKLIMLGAPGAGKGTQAEAISERYNIKTISTGNLLREAIKNQTEIGRAATTYMDSGNLVPDELVVKLLEVAIADCDNGYILDGFPRTVSQAKILDEMGIVINKVIEIVVSDEEITKRLSGRRVCQKCGATYHTIYKPTKLDGLCDKCGEATTLREDDKPETVKARLAVYHKQTEPLEKFYTEQEKLVKVYGQEDVKATTALTLAVVGG